MLEPVSREKTQLSPETVKNSGLTEDEFKGLDKHHAVFYSQVRPRRGHTVYIDLQIADVQKSFKHIGRVLNDTICYCADKARVWVEQNARQISLRYLVKRLNLPVDSRRIGGGPSAQ